MRKPKPKPKSKFEFPHVVAFMTAFASLLTALANIFKAFHG